MKTCAIKEAEIAFFNLTIMHIILHMNMQVETGLLDIHVSRIEEKLKRKQIKRPVGSHENKCCISRDTSILISFY